MNYRTIGSTRVRGSNPSSMKNANRKIALDLILKGNASRASIADQANLTRGGVTPIINELLKQRLIVECESVETYCGRPPILLRLNAQYVKVISVQWIRDQLNIALVGIDGIIQTFWRYGFSGNETVDSILQMIIQQVTCLVEREAGNLIIGMIVQAPGPLDAANGVVLKPSNFNGWQDIAIVDILSEHFDLPIVLENNLVGYTVAEQHFGYGRDLDHFIFLLVDDGIGAGFILNGQLYQGKSQQISEVGHISLDINGPQCSCGNCGCAEMYANVPAMCQIGLGLESRQTNVDWRQHMHELVQRYIMGDPACIRAIEHEVKYLGSLIVTLINTFDIDTVVIGSMLAIAQMQLQKPLYDYVSSRIASKSLLNLQLYFSQIEQPSIVGGALHMFDLFISNQLGSYEEIVERNKHILRVPEAPILLQV